MQGTNAVHEQPQAGYAYRATRKGIAKTQTEMVVYQGLVSGRHVVTDTQKRRYHARLITQKGKEATFEIDPQTACSS